MTEFRTITIPAYVHGALKASAQAAGKSMSELLADLVSTHCRVDGAGLPKSCGVRVSRSGDGNTVELVVRNKIAQLDMLECSELLAALNAALMKGGGPRRTSMRQSGGAFIQVAPRGRGIVVSIDGEDVAITTPMTRHLVDELEQSLRGDVG
jgi:hypothetical protein